VEDHPELKLNPRNEWLKANPLDNARLALWGQAKILSLEAYKEFNKLVNRLDIPEDAIPELTLPPEGSVKNYFAYLEVGEDLGYNSWEVQLIIAKDDELRTFLDRQLIDTPVASLELKVKNRDLFEQYDAYGDEESALYIADDDKRNEARDKLKADNPQWVDDMRRIEAIEHEAPDDIVGQWVERGKVTDEFEAGSSEAKVWLIDNPDAFKWALDQKLLTDDGSDWNVPVLRINAKWRKSDEEYAGFGDEEAPNYIEDDDKRQEARDAYLASDEDYRKDRRRREALEMSNTLTGERFPTGEIENFVNYYELPVKGFRQERFLIENKAFGKAMHTIQGLDLPDPAKVPAVQYDDIYDQYKDQFDEIKENANFESKYYIEDIKAREARDRQLRFTDDKYNEFGLAELRRNAYGLFVPDKQIENYVAYYKIIGEGKPKLRPGEKDAGWYENDWFMMEHMDFYKEVYLGILKNERRDFRKVPTRKVYDKYQRYLDLPKGKRRLDYRYDNPDLDAWGVIAFGWVPAAEPKRREELTPAEKRAEEVQERLEAMREKLKELTE